MTATHVGDLAVIADEPAISPIVSAADGSPIYFVQILRLLLEDESTVFGCLHCDFTAASPHSVRPHLNKHKDRTPQPAPAVPMTASLTIDDLIAKVNRLGIVEAERDGYKARALRAERELAAIKKALAVIKA